jgi:Kef-type K+ transport system membrane component KefB
LSTTMALVLVLTFAYVVGRLLERLKLRALPTTAVYVLVGVAVGPWAVHLVTVEIVATLQPFLSLLLGLVGFVMGLSLRRRMQYARGLEAGAISGLWVIGLVTLATWGFLVLVASASSPLHHL